MKNLSVALATYNEEKNIKDCLNSVKDLASEIVIVDGSSTDRTVEIAREFGAKVIITNNPKIFHINKQKAIDTSTNEWILQLDADERVSEELSQEIQNVINMGSDELENYQKNLKERKLFLKHQKLLEKRDGKIGKSDGEYAGFFIPRLNFFLGRYLRHGGVYPDGVIRLFRKGKAHFPCIDVHEQIEIEGRVGWLKTPLLHFDSPNFERYMQRNNRYVDLISQNLRNKNQKLATGFNYLFLKPSSWFLLTFFRHKGFLDGWPGFVFSFFSALRFPKAYIKSLSKNEK